MYDLVRPIAIERNPPFVAAMMRSEFSRHGRIVKHVGVASQ